MMANFGDGLIIILCANIHTKPLTLVFKKEICLLRQFLIVFYLQLGLGMQYTNILGIPQYHLNTDDNFKNQIPDLGVFIVAFRYLLNYCYYWNIQHVRNLYLI